jgi:two-component system, cell cycle sensor histidine kinase and response regulator CckA
MSGFGELALVSGALQLTVPSYSLRLVRRFGTSRVGWFVVAAFSSLAAMHFLKPLRPMNMGPASGMTLEIVFAIAAALLLLGLCHLETLMLERQQAERAEQRLRAQWECQVQEKTADLAQANQELLRRTARLEQAESALRESEAEYCLLFEENPQPMWIFDLRSLRLLIGNKAALRQYGFEAGEFRALTARELLPPAAAARFVQDAAKPCSGAQSRGLWQHRRKDGSLVEVEVTALDLHYGSAPARLMLASDITQRRQRERELCEAQKQEVVSRLAGGVAHHFNNTLSIISGYASLLLHRSQDEKAAEPLKQICAAVDRAAGLSRQLLITSGQFALRQELLDLDGLMTNLEPMLRRLVGKEIALQRSSAPGLPHILADARMVEHIVVNLVLNARDAMPHGGSLAICTDIVPGAECPSERARAAKPARVVRLTVRDTGSGIAPEVEPYLFEPFFSTRGIGKGRGLGLASVQGAVKQQAGWIEYTTQPGVGTEFRVFFPAASPAPAPAESDFRRWVRH